MGTRPGPSASKTVLDAIRESFSPNPASGDYLFRTLGYLDAGRAAYAIHTVAHRTSLLRKALARTGTGHDVPLADLVRQCDAFVRDYGYEGLVPPLPHIGWLEAVVDFTAVRERYGFSSTRSIETFEELLGYVSGAGEALASIQGRCLDVVAGIAEAGPASLRPSCDLAGALVSREVEEWTRVRRVLEATRKAVRAVLAQEDDFGRRRRLLAQRAEHEEEPEVARLLLSIAKCHTATAWLVLSPASRLVSCEAQGGYRLRLAFADGMARDIELGEDFWSTTGKDIDPALFRRVRLDRERNRLFWPNDVDVPGEWLHLAIKEGRLGAG